MEWLERVDQQGTEPTVSELNAVAGVLGKAAGALVLDAIAPDATALAIMERALNAVVTLMNFGASKALDATTNPGIARSHFCMMHYTL